MRIDILTLFPKMFSSVISETMLKRAQEKKKVKIQIHDLRLFAKDRHRTCDDRPFGGGPGMVLKPEPLDDAIKSIVKRRKRTNVHIVFVTPQGKPFSQGAAQRLSQEENLLIICGRYEGVDERIRQLWVDEEISIGDYVLTGGEIPAMVIMDALARLVPGVMGNADSKNFESFTQNLLEYPQYTRPETFRGLSVPHVLTKGNHKKIAQWRQTKSLERTRRRRPDLLSKTQ